MDVDAIVTELREAYNEVQDGALTIDRAEQLISEFDSLDTWLTGGGELPATWARPEYPVELLPAEQIALTVALNRAQRGEALLDNIATLCILALGRITGQFDYTQGIEWDIED